MRGLAAFIGMCLGAIAVGVSLIAVDLAAKPRAAVLVIVVGAVLGFVIGGASAPDR